MTMQHLECLIKKGQVKNTSARFAAKSCVSAAEQEMWKKSFGFFEKGLKNFEAIDDATNSALLLCNTGRLMRICAQAHSAVAVDRSRGEFSPEEALYYNKVTNLFRLVTEFTGKESKRSQLQTNTILESCSASSVSPYRPSTTTTGR